MATDLERLIVTVEANTRQFTRAMNALSGETDRAMRGVETSLSRAGTRIGESFGKSLIRGMAAFFTAGYALDAIKAYARQAGDAGGYEFSQGFNNALGNVQIGVGKALLDIKNTTIKEIQGIAGAAAKAGDFATEYLASTALGKLMGITQTISKEQLDQIRQLFGLSTGGLVTNLFKEGPPAIPIPQEKPSLPGMELLKNLESQAASLGDTARAQEVLNNLRQAGVDLDSEYAEKIALTTGKLYDQKQALESLNQLNADLQSSTETFAKSLLEGQSASESLTAALRELAEQLLHMAFQNLFNPGGTSLLQTIFGGLLNAGPIGSSAGSPGSVSNAPLGGNSGRIGSAAPQFNTNINVAGSVDQRTLGAMKGMIERNNIRQNQELQRTWGNRQARYSALRGP